MSKSTTKPQKQHDGKTAATGLIDDYTHAHHSGGCHRGKRCPVSEACVTFGSVSKCNGCGEAPAACKHVWQINPAVLDSIKRLALLPLYSMLLAHTHTYVEVKSTVSCHLCCTFVEHKLESQISILSILSLRLDDSESEYHTGSRSTEGRTLGDVRAASARKGEVRQLLPPLLLEEAPQDTVRIPSLHGDSEQSLGSKTSALGRNSVPFRPPKT
eukprot:4699011-Amphidinium_carterae.1